MNLNNGNGEMYMRHLSLTCQSVWHRTALTCHHGTNRYFDLMVIRESPVSPHKTSCNTSQDFSFGIHRYIGCVTSVHNTGLVFCWENVSSKCTIVLGKNLLPLAIVCTASEAPMDDFSNIPQ